MARAVNDEEHASLEVGGAPYEVVALDGFEAISELFHFEVRCVRPATAPGPAALIGERAVITLRDGFGRERRVTGLVAEAEAGVYDNDLALLTVVIRPLVYPISIGRDCYVLHDVDVVDVIKDVLFEHEGPVRYETTRIYQKRDFCAQYREDDWTFLDRLLEEEGICYWFDHAEDSAIVFADNTPSAPEIPGGGYIRYQVETNQRAEDEVIEAFGRVVQAVSTKFSITSFDPEKPLFKVNATVGDGQYEVYDAPAGGPNTPALCEARARTMQEIAQAARLEARGQSTSIRLVPGMVFSLWNHPVDGMDGPYLITEARTTVRQRLRAGGAERSYLCRFKAIPQATPYREPADTAPAKQQGLQLGVVVGAPGQEIHPDALGRVRVQLHWDRLGPRDHTAGKWMRVAQRSTTGSMLLPRIGWNVATFNEEGAIDAPTILSRIHDGDHPPAYALPANKTRVVWKTATSPADGTTNEIHFEDRKGAEHMFWNASRDMNVLVRNEKRHAIGNDQTRIIGGDHILSVTDDAKEDVRGDQVVTVGGSESITTGRGRNKSVGGNETVTIGGNRTLEVGEGHDLGVTGSRTLTVTGAMTEKSPEGMISTSSKIASVTVSGSMTRDAAQQISEDAGKSADQVISGVKVETAGKDRALTVSTTLTETLGALRLHSSAESVIDEAETSAWKVTQTLTGESPEIWIEAKEKLTLRCGPGVLVLTPTAITFEAAGFDMSGGHLEAVAGSIKHN